MTKQEEIREGINWLIRYAKPEDGTTMGDILFKYLHSQGVVISVSCSYCNGRGWSTHIEHRGNTSGMYNEDCPQCKGSGVAVEPLIKEK